jgi:hypothetical protein
LTFFLTSSNSCRMFTCLVVGVWFSWFFPLQNLSTNNELVLPECMSERITTSVSLGFNVPSFPVDLPRRLLPTAPNIILAVKSAKSVKGWARCADVMATGQALVLRRSVFSVTPITSSSLRRKR